MAKLTIVPRTSTGDVQGALRIRIKNVATGSYILDTADDSLVEVTTGVYASASDVDSVTYTAYVGDDPEVIDGYENVTFYGGPSANETFVNVLDYGAVGDGVTDDTAAINAALQALGQLNHSNVFVDQGYSAGGGVCYLPVGQYLVTSSLRFASGNIIRGEGRGTVIKFRPTALDVLFEVDPSRLTPASYRCVHVTIQDLSLAGDLQADGAIGTPGDQYANIAINFEKTTFSTIRNVLIQNFWTGVNYGGSALLWGYYHGIDQCVFYDCGTLAINIGDEGGPVVMTGGDISRSGAFVSGVLNGTKPDYAIKTAAQLTMIDVGMEMGTDVNLAFIREDGAEGCVRLLGGRYENPSGYPLVEADSLFARANRRDFAQTYTGAGLLRANNWGVRDTAEVGGSLPQRKFPPVCAVGNPRPVHLYLSDAESNTVRANNFDFNKRFFGYVYVNAMATNTYDTTTTFLNNGCAKLVLDKAGSTTPGTAFSQTFTYSQLIPFIGNRLYLAVVMKVDNRSKFTQLEIQMYQTGGQSADYKSAPATVSNDDFVFDYGNGFKLYVVDFMPNVDSSGTDDNLLCRIYAGVSAASPDPGTIYIAHWGLYTGGYPLIPTWDTTNRDFVSSAAPTFSLYIGGFVVGDRIWKYTPTANSTTGMGWVCTTAGTTFKGFGDIAA